MAGRKKNTLVNVFFKYVQLALSLITGIVLVPIYLTYIPIGHYGAWLAAASMVIWLAVFDPGIANILIQKVAEALGRHDQGAILGFINAGLVCAATIAVLIILIGTLGADAAIRFMGISQSDAPVAEAFHLVVFSTGLMVLSYAVTGVNYALQSSWAIGWTSVAATIVKVVTVLLLLRGNFGLMALPYSELSSVGILLCGGAALLVHNLKRHGIPYSLGVGQLRELSGLFFFSFGARLSKVVTRNIDNVFIARWLGPESVSIYNLTATPPRQSENLINQPITAFRPAVSHVYGSGEKRLTQQVLTRLLHIVFWASGLLFAGLASFNGDFVRLWVGAHLFAGAEISLALCVLFVLQVWTNSLGTLGFSLGDIRRNSHIEWVASVLMVPAVWYGCGLWGVAGVVLGRCAVLLLTSVWYFPLSLIRKAEFDRQVLANLGFSLVVAIAAALICWGLFRHMVIVGWGDLIRGALFLGMVYAILLVLGSQDFRREAGQLFSSLRALGCKP